MEVAEESFLTQLLRRFMQGGFIKPAGRESWQITSTGGGLIQYAISTALELSNMDWGQIINRIQNRFLEGNPMVRTILDLLQVFGLGSFGTAVRLILRAFEFLMRLMGMVGSKVAPASKLQSIKQ